MRRLPVTDYHIDVIIIVYSLEEKHYKHIWIFHIAL